jgi:hypothetical protein
MSWPGGNLTLDSGSWTLSCFDHGYPTMEQHYGVLEFVRSCCASCSDDHVITSDHSWCRQDRHDVRFHPNLLTITCAEINRSIVIDWLRNQHQEHPHIRVAVVYCSYQDRDNQSVFNLLAGVWRQILHPNAVHSEDVQKLYETYSNEGRPSLDVLTKIVSAEVQRHSKVFVIVDALDELSENTRDGLVRRLRSLQPTVNLLITSRKLGSIAEEFSDQPQLEIDAKNEDIITYIQARVSQDAKLYRAARRSPTLEADIKTQILEKSQKM